MGSAATKEAAPEVAADAIASARSAGLRYVTDSESGIRRHRTGRGFRYEGPDGKPLRSEADLARIKALVPSSDAAARRAIVAAIEEVAARLGNTRAVCRRCYVHPVVLDAYRDGSLAAAMRKPASPVRGGLQADEAALVRLLRQDAAAARRRTRRGRRSTLSSAAG
jgi:DNA topoisomerase IB